MDELWWRGEECKPPAIYEPVLGQIFRCHAHANLQTEQNASSQSFPRGNNIASFGAACQYALFSGLERLLPGV
jgi:hypothetical protein